MAKKCIVNRSESGDIKFVLTPNPNHSDAIKLAISRNNGKPLSQTSKGEPSLLYNSYIESVGLSPEAAEKAVAEQFSDKFGEWFGRWWEPGNTNVSKVVDENGQPRIVWSGQKGQHFTGEYKGYSDTFEKDGMMRFDRTALFTYNKYDALSYATGWDMPDAKAFERLGKYITEPYHLEPVFLNIRNIQSVEKLNYDKVIPRFPEFESKKIDGLKGFSDAANGAVRELLAIRDSHQMKLIRPEINLQNEAQYENLEPIPQEILDQVIRALMKKRLVNKVHIDSAEELMKVLRSLGIGEETMKQFEAWHGSPYLFDKFSTKFMGTGEGAQAFGWGLYFTDLEEIGEDYAKKLSNVTFEGKPYGSDNVGLVNATILLVRDVGNVEKAIDDLNKLIEKKGGSERSLSLLEFLSTNKDKYNVKKNLYNVSLHQGKTPEQYTWLEWDKPVTKELLDKVGLKFEIKKNSRGPYTINYANDPENRSPLGSAYKTRESAEEELKNLEIYGNSLYTGLIVKEGSPKAASLFLLENGIDGIKYPAESLSRGATSDDARGFNYVVFDENAVTINEVVQFQNELDKVGLKFIPNGFYRPLTREIYLNSENPRILETAIHEFAHPFLQYLRDNKPAHYRAGIKLLETNSEEAQQYMDLVSRTQPNLRKGSEEYYEEVLAQIVGDNGAKLVNSAKTNSIKQWLQNLWETVGKIIGITQRTPEEISKMTLRQFSDAVTAEMLDLQAVKNSSLTLSVLEQPHFTDMRGRSISPQTISNAVKGKGVKQIERQIITSVLEMPEFQTKKIQYDDFELAVKAQLMPLEKIETYSYAEYGSAEMGSFDSQKTIIYNSPLDHGVTGHFEGDYNIRTIDQLEYPTKPEIGDLEYFDEDTGERLIVTHGQEPIPIDSLTDQEIQEILEKSYQYQIERYNELLTTLPKSKPNQGLFGHTRVWTKDDIYNVAEVQSDVFQKDNLHKIAEFGYKELDKLRKVDEKVINRRYNEIFSKILSPIELPYHKDDFNEDALNKAIDEKTVLNEKEILENRRTIAILRDKQFEVRNNVEYDRLESEIDRLNKLNSSLRFYEKSSLILQRLIEINNLNDKKYEKTLNENEKQFLASEKFFELRLIRESIQDAANQGFKKLRLPLPYTLSKIEGYLDEGGQVQIEGEPTIGEYVDYMGTSNYRIVDYEGDDIKIIYDRNLKDVDKDQYIKDWAYNEIESILYDYFQDESTYSLDEIKSKLDQTELKDKTKYDIVQMLKEESEQTDEIDITEYRDQMEEIFVENVSKSDLEEYLSDLDYSTVVFTKDRILYSQDEGEWVSYSNGFQDKESFAIEDLSEYHQPVARRYEYFGKLLEKERPNNLQIIDDENGNPWYETQILESDKDSPVLAFQAERQAQDLLIRTGLELGYEYDTDKVARERFNIPSLKRISSGSDRVVYEIDQNYVLKVAKTARGLEQNLHEGNDMLVKEDLIPNVVEAGLNYVVVEKVTPIKAKDLVPIYDTEGEQIGTERADRMFAELSRFRQSDFELRNQKFIDTLYKYGMYDVTNHELLVRDFARKTNWGIRDGRPIHIDAGTFAGESLLTDYAGQRNLDDPEFREIYERSRQAKKLYGDRDRNTMFQIEDRNEKNLIKEKAIQNGTWMKAPNGKPTNLNEYQYLEVRTERFKKWFGDWENDPKNASKVVDENGEPRVMYTGTSKDKDFKKFNVPRNGAWFTSDPNEASMYAMDNDSKTVKIDSSGNYKDVNTASRVIPVFLNLKTIADFNQEVTPEQREKLKYANNYKKIQGDLFQNIYFSRPLGENRFDGIDYNGDGKIMVVLMNPNTIKSAIANTGEYSLDNNDIRFQISEVIQNQMIPSQLYEQLRQQPFVDSEQALEAYKNVYTDSVGDWQSTEFNC